MAETNVKLLKRLGAFEVFSISTGTMIGAGIFVLPSLLFEKAGPASMLCFLIAGAIATCAGFSACELATAMPRSGGSYYFVSRSMGAMFGSIVGLGSLLGLVFKGAFAFIGAGDYFEVLVPVNPMITALALCALFISINAAGTSTSGRLQNLFVVFLTVTFVMFIGQGLFSVKISNLQPFFSRSALSFFEATGMVLITYLGLINVTAVSEEVKNPGRNIPLGVLLSVVFVTVLYTLVMLVTEGVLRFTALTTTPVADAAEVFAGRGGLIIVVLCGLAATISTGNAAIMSSSRYPFAMARDKLMPGWLARVDPTLKTPSRSIMLVGAIMFAVLILLDLEYIVKLGSAFNVIAFSLIHISVIILRKANPDWYRPSFRSPLYPWIQALGIAGGLALIPSMGLAPSLSALILVAVGIAWYHLYGRKKAEPGYGLRDAIRTLQDRRATQQALEAYDDTERHAWKLLVPLWFSSVPSGLLKIAGYMARSFDEKAHLVFCNEIPEQTPPPETEEEMSWCLDLESCTMPLGEEVKPYFQLTNLYACSRDAGFIEMAEDYDTDLALMEWPPENRHLLWEVNQIVRYMPCDMAFYVSRALPEIRRILVATGIPEDKLKLTIAGAIAEETGASVTVMVAYPTRVKEMSAGDLEKRILKTGVLFSIPLEAKAVLTDDVGESIVEESKGYDLLIVGSAPEVKWLKTPFGPLVDDLMEKVNCPIIVTRPMPSAEPKLYTRALKRLVGMP